MRLPLFLKFSVLVVPLLLRGLVVNAQLPATSSVLATGEWYKISTCSEGIYRLSYEQLKSMGIPEPYPSNTFRLFGNGGAMLPEANRLPRQDDLRENSVEVVDGGDGVIQAGDYILFYAEPVNPWKYDVFSGRYLHETNLYSDSSYYFITFGQLPGRRIADAPVPSQNPDAEIYSTLHMDFHELDSLNLLRSGKQWFGEDFGTLTTRYFCFYIPDIEDSLNIRLSFLGRSTLKSAVTLSACGKQVSDSIWPIDGNINSDYARFCELNLNVDPQQDTVVVGVTYYKPEPAATGWLNFIEVTGKRSLEFHEPYMPVISRAGGVGVSRFHIASAAPSLRVWDVTAPGDVLNCPGQIAGGVFSFKTATPSDKRFLAFDGSTFQVPGLCGQIPNQNLHGMGPAGLLIIYHPEFELQAAQLAEMHSLRDGMMVGMAGTEQIFNEFSSGKQDVAAIRDFIRMFYKRYANDSTNRLRYALLLGDGSYDYKNRIPDNTNFVPAYQTQNSMLPTSSFVTDDFYALLDSTEGESPYGKLDIGVGRFPVSDVEEAATMTRKVMIYSSFADLQPDDGYGKPVSNLAPWRNTVCFVADDEDINLHIKQAEKMAFMVDSSDRELNVRKIYFDAFKQYVTPYGTRYPGASKAIDGQVEKGALIINYTGHGGEVGWAEELCLTMGQVEQYQNRYNLPVFITATCEFSRYDNPALTSAGEKLLFNEHGGSIALFTTTRVAYAHSNEIINRNLLRRLFESGGRSGIRFGEAIQQAKNMCGPGVYMQNFTLLGDPALSLAIPKYRVITTFIGTDSALVSSDTLRNRDVVTVKGYIADNDSNIVSGFNGELFPLVLDRPVQYATLANDPPNSSVYPFSMDDKVLFSGRAIVNGGEFSFSFFVPLDLSYGNGYGTISYYARSAEADAGGVADSICFFNDGTDDDTDSTGPQIEIFVGNRTFADGGSTGTTPVIWAVLHDTSSINCFGLGFGHDITAVVDGDVSNPIILNDRFSFYPDSYTRGEAAWSAGVFSYGSHTIKVTGWDLLNNPGEKEVTFNVVSPGDLGLGKVYNYPDPVQDHTWFYIEHNMSTRPMSVLIQVYNIQGQLAVTLSSDIPAGAFFPLRVYWNGEGNGGQKLDKGFYTYKVSLTDDSGRVMERADKLIIIK